MSPVFLAGPTAVGKSAVALELAERLGGEIISVDSMQVYRGLDIGTAKPNPEEREKISHHLIDVVGFDEPFDAARFVAHARDAMEQIAARGRRPLFCGGTGMYFKAWFEGLGTSPTSDPELRRELESIPLSNLLDELAARDPVAFESIDRDNARRVVRAIEVIRLTGRPFSEQRTGWRSAEIRGQKSEVSAQSTMHDGLNPDGEAGGAIASGSSRREEAHLPNHSEPPDVGCYEDGSPRPSPPFVFCLRREREDLRTRIDARVDAMFSAGLVAETEALLARGLEQNRTAMQAIGYRQVVEHLHGELGLNETIQLIKTKTWQFARRQKTWFRNQLPVEWVDVSADATASGLADNLAAKL